MKAMILAAGLGTRLRPLTDDRPKALVEVAGRTLLEITLEGLKSAGVREAIVNVHHFADKIVEYLAAKNNFGMQVAVSREEELLDTGGGLKKAAWFFAGDHEPFFLHNVDVISNIDLPAMMAQHREQGALATLAVQERETSRYLLFDDELELCGRRLGKDGTAELVRRVPSKLHTLAFAGIHVISPRFLSEISETGAFSIITTYLRLAGQGGKIHGFRAGGCYWRDLGKPESVKQAAEDFKKRAIK